RTVQHHRQRLAPRRPRRPRGAVHAGAGMTFELNLEGGAEVLKVMAAETIYKLADVIGASAGEDAKVSKFVTDRAHASVSVPAEQQAKAGVLTRAFADAGIEIKPPKAAQRRRAQKPARRRARGK